MCTIATIILKHALSKCLISGARCYPFSTACRYIINGRQAEWLVSGCAKSVGVADVVGGSALVIIHSYLLRTGQD